MDAIRFGTDGWRAPLDVFTAERVRQVGQAIATYLDDEGTSGPVAVGYDARETSPEFAEAAADVLAANGRDVLLPRRDVPTPIVAWTVVDRGLAGAVVITASHNPPEFNGLKFIPADGAPADQSVTDAIEARLATPQAGGASGQIREVDFVEPYATHVLEQVDVDLSGITVAYDAMHGSGRGVTDMLLNRAGADVVRLRCNRDPTFGGRRPEPSEELLSDLLSATTEADVGIANDGDADRIAVATPEGYLDENLFFAAVYDALLEADDGPAVRTVSTTFLIDRIAEAHGERVIETPVGFKWVAAAMADHDALVGGEESGGFSVRGHVREKDGVFMAVLAAAMAADRPLQDRVDAILAEYGTVHQEKVSVDCRPADHRRILAGIADRLPAAVAGETVDRVNDDDGLKILLADGSWLLVRPSGTEPKIRVYAEAATESRVEELLAAGRALVDDVQ